MLHVTTPGSARERVHQERQPAEARARRRSRGPRLRAAVRRGRRGMGLRRARPRFRLRAMARPRRPPVPRRRDPARRGAIRNGSRAPSSRMPTTAACRARAASRRRCMRATRWPASSPRRARAAEQERARPRGRVGREADEGQSVCPRRQAGGPAQAAPRSLACRSSSTSPTSSRLCASAPTRSGLRGVL